MMDKRYPGPETIHKVELANGITILAYESFAAESVVIEGLIKGAGGLSDTLNQAGLADFTADLLMRGTQKRDFTSINEDLESVGAYLGIGSGRHVTQFSAHSLVEDVDLILDLLAQALRTPTFPEEQVEQVRGLNLTGLQMRADDTRQMANLRFMETTYAGHPYGRSLRGYPETLAAISRDDLAAFHKRHYGPQGMIIALVGAVPIKTAIEKVTAVFADWQNVEQVVTTAVAAMPRPAQIVYTHAHIPEKSQADIVLGLPGPLRSAPDYLHASLMNTILGVFGMMGRIGNNVREEKGLAYYAASHLSGGLGPSPWTAYAGVAPDKVELAIAGILEEIDRIQQEPVPAEELADNIAYRTGSLPVSLETNAALADVIVDLELFDLGLDYLQGFSHQMRNVNADQVQAAAQKYLSSEQLVISVAGPEGRRGK
ncbi:MAG: insulinase family protein [Anaerolineales bacterium]|nr:insulinase family protein [Anaerolineales bacterium]